MNRLLIAGAAVLLVAAPLALALWQTVGLTGAAPAGRLDGQVRDYLLRNPEVLVEALQVYQQRAERAGGRARAAQLESRRDELVGDPRDPVGGNPEGTVTVVEFFDYNCPYCKRAMPVVTALLEARDDVRYVYKEFPILADSSRVAARLALAVNRRQPELYVPLHNALLAHRGQLDEAAIAEIAARVGVTPETLAARDAPEIEAQIAATLQLARAIGVTGTPSFVIGDQLLPGLQSLEDLEAAVERVGADRRS